MKRLLTVVLSSLLLASGVYAAEITPPGQTAPVAHGDLAAPSKWAREYVSKADRLCITKYFKKAWTSNISRKDFCTLAYNMLDRVKDINWKNNNEVFDDTDNEKVISLYLEGIIEGKGEKTFAPDEKITREEAAVILCRISDYLSLSHTELYFDFNDSADISDWANDSVQKACNLSVMNGVGGGKFDPKGGYTVEAAVTTLVRMFDLTEKSDLVYMTFADKLYECMPTDKNYTISPLSIEMVLTMAANGAGGRTQSEILNAMNAYDLETENRSAYHTLDDYSRSDLLKLNVSNSIWLNSDKRPLKFSKEYTDLVQNVFSADAETVNTNSASEKINSWVSDKTNEKINSIIDKENEDFDAMLVNAVYFKGRWQSEFNKNNTKKAPFTSRDGLTADIDFMNKTDWIKYGELDGVAAVELPYLTRDDVFDENGEYVLTNILKNMNVSMYLIMSDKRVSPDQILGKMDFSRKYLLLSIPKFKVEYSEDMTDIMKKIGIKKAFEENADFEKMIDGEGSIWIDSLLHKTYISVDEEGTEAAAVSAARMAGTSLPPEPIELRFDKPFTFVIKDNINGKILFMGEYAFAK